MPADLSQSPLVERWAGQRVHFIPISKNAKTGPIPASIIERASCWPGCALYGNGCYAETGVTYSVQRVL